MRLIASHEQACPYEEVERLLAALTRGEDESGHLAELTELVRRDLAVRMYATSELGLDADIEMFAFARPVFKVLSGRGISVREEDGEIHLTWSPPDRPLSS